MSCWASKAEAGLNLFLFMRFAQCNGQWEAMQVDVECDGCAYLRIGVQTSLMNNICMRCMGPSVRGTCSVVTE